MKTRWGISKQKKAIWFYKKNEKSRSMCWVWGKQDLDQHFRDCEMTNLEYLEGCNLLAEVKGDRI